MDIGALSLLISESGFAATMQKVEQIDRAAARVGARPTEVRVAAPTAATVQQSLTRIQQTATAIAGSPIGMRITFASVEAATRAVDQLGRETQQTEQQTRAGAAAWQAYAAGVIQAQRALAGVRSGAAIPPSSVPTTPPIAPAARPALAPQAVPVVAPLAEQQAARIAALTAALNEFAQAGRTAEQRAQILATALAADARAAEASTAAAKGLSIAEREGAAAIALRTRALHEMREAQNQANREANIAAQQRFQTPASTGGIRQLGPATPEVEQQFVARAEATAQAAQRAAAAQSALAAQTARAAQAAQAAATAQQAQGASTTAAARASQQAVTAMQAHAAQQQRAAATAQTAAQAQAALATQTANTAQGQQNAAAATAAHTNAQQQQARAIQATTAAQQALAQATTATGNSAQALSPKVRSAANGIAAVAFASMSSGDSFQSMALGAGLAGSALSDAFGSSKMAMYASGIGAALVVVGTFVGVLERMTDAAARARTANDAVVRSIQNIKGVTEAQSALARAEQDLAQAETELAAARQRLMQGGPSAFSIVPDIAAMRTAQKVVEQLTERRTAARHQVKANEIRDTTEMAEARREIVVEGLAAEARARDAAQQAALASEATAFTTGRNSLEKFFAARLAFIEQSSQREIAVLRARQQTLAEPRPDAPPEDSARRAAEIQRLGVQIREIESRVREESATTIEQRRAQREALNKQILGFETREAEAHGDASKQRIEQAKIEATEIARALVQRSGAATPEALAQAWADANAAAQKYVNTQTRMIGMQREQQAAQRVFNDLEIARLEIQQLLARGVIDEAEAQQRLAAEERKRIADLVKIAEAMERFGTELNNPDLIAAARRLRTEINGLANAPLGPLAQRLKAIRDELSVAAKEGDQAAADLLRRINERVGQSGGKITIGVVLEAEWQRDIEAQLKQGLAMQEILLKPDNIKLVGVAGAIGQLNQELSGLALNAGNAIGNALAAGFASAFTKGSGKSFLEAVGNSILQGIGGMMVQLGSAMLSYGLIMAVAAPLLAFTPFANQALSAPVAIAAGTGLIALGAGMGAIAANNTGSRTGGGGGGSSGARQSTAIPPQRVLLDPDRHLRERRELGITARGGEGLRAIAPPAPVVNNFTLLGSPNPQIERFIAKASVGADGRSIPITRRRR